MKGESVLKIAYNKPTWKPVDSLLHITLDTRGMDTGNQKGILNKAGSTGNRTPSK